MEIALGGARNALGLAFRGPQNGPVARRGGREGGRALLPWPLVSLVYALSATSAPRASRWLCRACVWIFLCSCLLPDFSLPFVSGAGSWPWDPQGRSKAPTKQTRHRTLRLRLEISPNKVRARR